MPLFVSRIADIRETAFVYAITAAGVTHAVTQACSMGDLLQCGCEATRNRPPPKPLSSSSYGDGVKWEWGGCVDDVEFGYEKSRQFMDAKRRRGKSDIRALIDLHNNEAGRLVRDVYSESTVVSVLPGVTLCSLFSFHSLLASSCVEMSLKRPFKTPVILRVDCPAHPVKSDPSSVARHCYEF